MKTTTPRIKIKKGVITATVLTMLWLPLLVGAITLDKNAKNPAWMDWSFFGNTVITASVARWHNPRPHD